MTDVFAFVRAARGPVLMIALGVLFLLDQYASIHFSRTWPILFILYGVLKLVERLIAPPVPAPAPAPGWTPPSPRPWTPPTQSGVQSPTQGGVQ